MDECTICRSLGFPRASSEHRSGEMGSAGRGKCDMASATRSHRFVAVTVTKINNQHTLYGHVIRVGSPGLCVCKVFICKVTGPVTVPGDNKHWQM